LKAKRARKKPEAAEFLENAPHEVDSALLDVRAEYRAAIEALLGPAEVQAIAFQANFTAEERVWLMQEEELVDELPETSKMVPVVLKKVV